jgi:hypothetical protein
MSFFPVWHKLRRLRAALGLGHAPSSSARSKNRRTFQLETLEERAVPATWYVATSGSDQSGFGSDPNHPFASLQFAVNTAASGDVIKVAAGKYGYNASQDNASPNFGTTGVVAVYDKQLTLLGGYSTSNWNAANPTANQTIIDGGGQVRGVYVVFNINPTGLDIEGFTVQNGVGGSNPKRTGADFINGYGGGIFVDEGASLTTNVPIVVKNVVFQNDTAQASNTSSGAGGAGGGGGFAIIGGTNVTLTNVTFQNDKALGGTGPQLGGGALGGAFFATTGAIVTGSNLTFTNSTAIAGSSSGSGIDSSGGTADALGGAMAVQNGSKVSFSSVSITGSTATGGNANTASGSRSGAAFGGGIFVENASVSLMNATISNNVAQSGSAFTGNIGGGGGIETANADLILNQVTVSQNSAISGNSTGGGSVGSTGGGGLYLTRFQTGSFGNTLTLTNTLIDDNIAKLGSSGSLTGAGGGGGGLYLQGVPVTITESTIANNQLGPNIGNGYSILTLASNSSTPMTLNLNDDIIANASANASNAPVTVQTGSTVNVNRTMFVVPSSSTPLFNGVNAQAPGTVNTVNGASTDEITAPSAGFVSPGAPNFNYGLTSSSPARGLAVNSGVTVDRAGNSRPTNADLGAFQFSPPTIQFQNLDTQASKTGGQVTIVVALSAPAATPVSVDFATSDGTAKAGVDYTPRSGTLNFAVGATTASFTIPILNDGTQTGDLRINLTLSNPVNVSFGFQTHAVATILDNNPTDNMEFISGLYHSLLGRPVDQGGLNFFITPLLNTENPQLPGVLFNFVNAQGYFAQLVGNHTNGFYHRFLGQDPQPGDPNVDFWANQMVAGMTDEQVIAAFLSSPQYFNSKSNGDNVTWLQNVYHDLFNRTLDASGQNFWTTQIAGGATLNSVALSLLSSSEYRFDLIDGYFQLYLNRPTNSTDRQYWLSQFQAGQTDEQVIVGIGGSVEGLEQNGGTNEKWITTLYQKLLGRTPRADELAFHLNELENDAQTLFDNAYHLQRFYTAQAVLRSGEFTSRGTFSLAASLNMVISQTFQQGMGKNASADDLAYWSSQFVGDANQNLDVASAILASSDDFQEAHVFP